MTIRHHLTRLLYRRYRALRKFFSTRPPDQLSRAFYWSRTRLQRLISARNRSSSPAEDRIWKAIYFHRFGSEPLFSLETENPIATASADHQWPRGTASDYSRNRNFNLKLYHHFGYRSDLRVLDLGCAGGAFVKSILEDGYTAIGIEGSDFSRKLRSGAWDTCPHHLLTADITARFQLRDRAGHPMQFQCITAWEVLEHIPEAKLPGLLDNIARHLSGDGIFVASVDTIPDADPTIGAVYHVTLRPKPWWLDQFARCSLIECKGHPFTTQDYVRGHGRGLEDWDPAEGDGFHLVLTDRGGGAPGSRWPHEGQE
jgi:2-polyprenyl-3-methyl-5-hydroxy-6-metoxy-1,4-benzoquinol methylase